MPWTIGPDGKPRKVEVKVGLSPAEVAPSVVEVTLTDGVLECPHCDKTYKTEAGFENHLADKH
jgi:hypothetical protein